MSDERVEEPGEKVERPVGPEAAPAATEATGEKPVEPGAAPEPEAAPAEDAPSPDPAIAPRPARQWVSMRSASLDLRIGAGALPALAHALRSSAGRPHVCAVVCEPGAPAETVRVLSDNLSAEGFEVRMVELADAGCSLEAALALDARLAEARVTSDDIVVAVGGQRTLSMASYACSTWCGGVPLALVPTDLASALAAAVTPRALDVAGVARMVSQDGMARYLAIDEDLLARDLASDEGRLTCALMAQTACCESDRSFGHLWDGVDELLSGDVAARAERLQDSIKARGKVASSASAATRGSLELGTTFAHVLRALAPQVDEATALADGIRFASRLSVALGTLEIDEMLTIDELLARLGLDTARAEVDPAALAAGLREERYRRSNRLMLALPRALGRTRLAVVTDELLAEHAAAWCGSRPTD